MKNLGSPENPTNRVIPVANMGEAAISNLEKPLLSETAARDSISVHELRTPVRSCVLPRWRST